MIWFDCDGVLARFHEKFAKRASAILGCPVHAPEDFTTWDIDQFYDTLYGKGSGNKVWKSVNTTPGFVRDMKQHDDFVDLVKTLKSDGYEVGCATSPVLTSPYWINERYGWLDKRGINKKSVYIASDKSYIKGNVLIDDKPENCIDWAENFPAGAAILVDRPWNRTAELPGSVLRAKSAEAIYDFLTETFPLDGSPLFPFDA